MVVVLPYVLAVCACCLRLLCVCRLCLVLYACAVCACSGLGGGIGCACGFPSHAPRQDKPNQRRQVCAARLSAGRLQPFFVSHFHMFYLHLPLCACFLGVALCLCMVVCFACFACLIRVSALVCMLASSRPVFFLFFFLRNRRDPSFL